jgi:hypothetical protein
LTHFGFIIVEGRTFLTVLLVYAKIEPTVPFITRKPYVSQQMQNIFDIVFYKYGKRLLISIDEKLPISKKDFKLLFCHELINDCICELIFGLFEKAVAL